MQIHHNIIQLIYLILNCYVEKHISVRNVSLAQVFKVFVSVSLFACVQDSGNCNVVMLHIMF